MLRCGRIGRAAVRLEASFPGPPPNSARLCSSAGGRANMENKARVMRVPRGCSVLTVMVFPAREVQWTRDQRAATLVYPGCLMCFRGCWYYPQGYLRLRPDRQFELPSSRGPRRIQERIQDLCAPPVPRHRQLNPVYAGRTATGPAGFSAHLRDDQDAGEDHGCAEEADGAQPLAEDLPAREGADHHADLTDGS